MTLEFMSFMVNSLLIVFLIVLLFYSILKLIDEIRTAKELNQMRIIRERMMDRIDFMVREWDR